MAKTVITASTNSPTNLFVIDGKEYPKDNFQIISALVEDSEGNQSLNIGLQNLDTEETVVYPKRPTDWNNGTSDYADYDAAVSGIVGIINT